LPASPSWATCGLVFRLTGGTRGNDIETLWELFELALSLPGPDETPGAAARGAFLRAYDLVRAQRGVAWNITIGLYWARPYRFLPLDLNTGATCADG
jgi:5-methylcytosine-specific restriction protein B